LILHLKPQIPEFTSTITLSMQPPLFYINLKVISRHLQCPQDNFSVVKKEAADKIV
jgi:hypothetical protein